MRKSKLVVNPRYVAARHDRTEPEQPELTPTRGFEPGTVNLKGLNGFTIENQKIVSAAPILWTRT